MIALKILNFSDFLVPKNMKCLLCMTMIILSCRVNGETFSNYDRQKLLDHLNNFRSKFAAAAQISNMYELEYNMIREKEAENYTTSCPISEDVINQTNYAPIDENFDEKFLKYTTRNFKEFNSTKEFLDDDDLFSGLLGSLFMEVGCSHLPKHCKLDVSDSVARIIIGLEKMTIRQMCVFGPFMNANNLDWVHGKPGSSCVYGNTENGLCKKAEVVG